MKPDAQKLLDKAERAIQSRVSNATPGRAHAVCPYELDWCQ